MKKVESKWTHGNEEFQKKGFRAYLGKKGPDTVTPEERELIDRAIAENKLVKLPPSSALLEGHDGKPIQTPPRT